MRRRIVVSFGLLTVFFLGCTDLSSLGLESYTSETMPEFYFGAGPGISLEVSINGQAADESSGLVFTPGEPLVWEYRITNTGSEILHQVWVSDDNVSNVCDYIILSPGQETSCTYEWEAEEGQYTITGTVFGRSATSIFAPPVQAVVSSHYEGSVDVVQAQTALAVDILIKVGGGLPCINPNSRGRTPMAILGSSDLDPATIDGSTLMAGDLTSAVSPVKWAVVGDVNGDGFSDLVMHFLTQALAEKDLLQDGEELVISGATIEPDPESFAGSAMVRLTPGPLCRNRR